MQVILREKIRSLGDLGELVHVRPGYARNFLVPKKLALQATKANMERFEAERAALEKVAADKLKQAQDRAKKVEVLKIEILANAGDGGKLFGSIGTKDIADAITAQGVSIERHELKMPHGVIRELGDYQVAVHLHTDVEVHVSVSVKSDGQSSFTEKDKSGDTRIGLFDPDAMDDE